LLALVHKIREGVIAQCKRKSFHHSLLDLVHLFQSDPNLGTKKLFLVGGSMGGLLETEVTIKLNERNLLHLLDGAVMSCTLVTIAEDAHPPWIIKQVRIMRCLMLS
jgi:pimeloyl-ACP methyl ester carboxylesterase